MCLHGFIQPGRLLPIITGTMILSNKWINEIDEFEALKDLDVLLSILELLEEQKHDQFCQPFLASKISDPNPSFIE